MNQNCKICQTLTDGATYCLRCEDRVTDARQLGYALSQDPKHTFIDYDPLCQACGDSLPPNAYDDSHCSAKCYNEALRDYQEYMEERC